MPVARLNRHGGANRAEHLGRSGGRLGRRRQRHRLTPAGQQDLARRQGVAPLERVDGQHIRVVRGRDVGERAYRQAVAHRRVARQEEQLAPPQTPALRHPAPAALLAVPNLDRHHVAGGLVKAALEHLDDAGALLRIVELVVERVEIERQLLLYEQEVRPVFVCGHGAIGGQVELLGKRYRKPRGIGHGRGLYWHLVVDKRIVFPKRLLVFAPV